MSYHSAFSYCSCGSQGSNIRVFCHSLLQWTTFCQNSPICLRRRPCTAWFIASLSYTRLWSMWSFCLAFYDCYFHSGGCRIVILASSARPLMDEDETCTSFLYKSLERNWLWGKSGLALVGRAMLSKSLVQFSIDGQGCVPILLSDVRSKYGGDNEYNGNLLWKVPCMHCRTHCLQHHNRPPPTHASAGDSGTLIGKSESVSCGVTASFSWVLVSTRFCLCPLRVCFCSPV